MSRFLEIVELYAQTQVEIDDYYAESDDESVDEFEANEKSTHALKRKREFIHRNRSKILSLRHQRNCADRVCAAKARDKEDDRMFRLELILTTN